ncbi:MAG: hypothetical protein M3391_07050 [Actinomycetota bacterium]|nr:hypothetical protein [Actinomycetota bacterium]
MPLSPDAPRDSKSSSIISFLKQDSSFPYVRITGTGDNQWGSPVYVSKLDTPAVRLDCTGWCPAAIPDRIHLPAAATVPNTSDGTVTLYDEYRGYVLGLWRASPNEDGSWTAQGADVYYSDSNGLAGSLPGSDEARNAGHRGLNSMVRVLRYDEVKSGAVDHVLELFVNTARMEHVFPMTGHEFHGTMDVNAPPEGTRIRIKPWINLNGYNLSPAAKVIATALQRYGAVIGDQTGGPASIGVENTVLGGRGDLWRSLLTPDALKGIPFDAFEVIELGYDPTALP